MKITFKEEIFNPVYMPYFNNRSRYLLMVGGAGSGKSEFAAQKCLLLLLGPWRERILIVRKVGLSIRNSSFQLLKDIISRWNLSHLFEVLSSKMIIRCRSNGNEIISSGLDDVEKLKSIHGVTKIWIEEATELLRHDLLQLDLRLRGQVDLYKQIIMTFNPIDEEHWIRKRWFPDDRMHKIKFDAIEETEGQTVTTSVLRTTSDDNKFMFPEDRAVLRALQEQDENYYRIYALGQWGQKTEGLIYKNFEIVDTWPEAADPVHGLDFGFIRPTFLGRFGLHEGKVYIDELLYRKDLTNTELIEILPDVIPNRRSVIYGDNAEPNRIQEIYRRGYNIHPADKDVEAGIDLVRSLPLCITASSANVLKEIRRYKWKQDKNGKFLDEPVKMDDHAMDGTRYAIYSHEQRIPRYWSRDKKSFKRKLSGGRGRRRQSAHTGLEDY